MELDQRSYGRRMRGGANNLSDIVPQGGDKGIPSGGLPGKGRDVDGDEGKFLAQTCTGRRDHFGGGKPPSSKVPTMRHTEWTHTEWYSMVKPRQKGGVGPTQLREEEEGGIRQPIG